MGFQDEIQKALSAKRTIIGNNLVGLDNDLEKGGKPAGIGEIRTFGGKQYVKTAAGWSLYRSGGSKTPAVAPQQQFTSISKDGVTPTNPNMILGKTSTGKDVHLDAHHENHRDFSSKEVAEAKQIHTDHQNKHKDSMSAQDHQYAHEQRSKLQAKFEDHQAMEEHLALKQKRKEAGKGKFSADGNDLINNAGDHLHPYLTKLGVKINSDEDEGVHELTDKNGKKHTITREDDPYKAMAKYAKIAKLHGGRIKHDHDSEGGDDEHFVKFGH